MKYLKGCQPTLKQRLRWAYLDVKRETYWNFRYIKGWLFREPACGDCDMRGCRGECCGAVGW